MMMTLVLQRIAAAANRGYTGTDVAVGQGTAGVIVRATLGSLPVSAWRVAHDNLGRAFDADRIDALTTLIVVALLAAIGRSFVIATRPAGATAEVSPGTTRDAWSTTLVASAAGVLWIGATLVQAST